MGNGEGSILTRWFKARGAKWLGTVPQGQFLRALGIETRAQNLAQYAPEHHEAIHAAMERLIGEGQMGALGEVLADPSVVKVLHDATQDLQILARATGTLPVNSFDTQRAAGLVGQTATASA